VLPWNAIQFLPRQNDSQIVFSVYVLIRFYGSDGWFSVWRPCPLKTFGDAKLMSQAKAMPFSTGPIKKHKKAEQFHHSKYTIP
jgi:hypothetical protein